MSVALESNAVFIAIEYLAIFCSGLSGGLAATRKHYDIFTILIISWVTALGGGIVRDVLLGSLPPAGITNKGYVLSALLSGIVIAVAHPEIGNLTRSMVVVDAMALGLFAVNGTAKAMAFHTSGMTAVFMGMFTALAGGVIRDALLNEVPSVIRDKHWYAVPSFVGCILTVVVGKFVEAGKINLHGEMILDIAIVALIVAMRLLSVKFNIMLPGALERERAHLNMRSRYLRRPVVHPQMHEVHRDNHEGSAPHNPDDLA
ncbi:trimeric intracellular cation channel family protein [Bifidobacterium sp.]|uniref:trimeric intracellular cation channel family protein n=1 Tax=Bifidobacterium sp. TaxID=41200 RepID=UPI0025BA2BF0|nr:TRIC cation channel family protein [Bifidobacterium sp.]MCH4160128.1 TRIC cation channel family protein [Bifidobacterium sp.]MCH4174402.1 TRIC cation channel family protein [Bifidobacterium sp.]MCI1635811.1 TRIC cation channel family protein [Bifidobacterium sp.]